VAGVNLEGAVDLMAEIKPKPVTTNAKIADCVSEVFDFSVQLFQNSASTHKNSMISPFSVLYALGMTANGAKGNTLAQIEDVFGVSIPKLNEYLHVYMNNLPSGDKCKLSLVNSVWFRDVETFAVNEDFLQLSADYYDAAIYKAPFDEKTLKAINGWVKTRTDGMIEEILDEIAELAVMYLINAMSFDAEWMNIYKENQVHTGVFTSLSGEKRGTEMMYCTEYAYLDNGSASGFIKYYSGGRYAFAALLPNEGISINDYVATLTGQGLAGTLKNVQRVKVDTAIPKFESEYALEMKDILIGMGMPDAFNSMFADLDGLGLSSDGNLYISRVIHKSFVAVDERGTKAGASTVVEVSRSGSPEPEETKTVYLDKPFLYMIIDSETGIPLFIGTVLDL
jgi:serpin B